MKNLKVYMAERNISVKQASEEIGCGIVSISRWRTGKSIPSPEFMDRIKAWSNGEISADSFYTWKATPKSPS